MGPQAAVPKNNVLLISMKKRRASKIRRPAASGTATVGKVERFATTESASSRVYDATCSNLRIIVSPTLYPHVTFSERAKRDLAEKAAGVRIFTSWDARDSRDSRDARDAFGGRPRGPSPCKLDAESLGRVTLSQVPREILLSSGATYAGNWAIMVNTGAAPSSPRRYLTVCGFFDCGLHGPEHDTERFVKHVNLCEYGRSIKEGLIYLFSGTFAASGDGGTSAGPPSRARFFVNARSGTWAIAKKILAFSGRAGSVDATDLDRAVVDLAKPKVVNVVRRALLHGRNTPKPPKRI
jgi:hypothetical protein